MDIKRLLKARLRKQINCYRKYKIYRTKFTEKEAVNVHPLVIYMADGQLKHGGLADRLKGIISTYALCKVLNLDFRIDFSHPFKLETYFTYNTYNWKLRDDERVILNKKQATIINACNEFSGKTLLGIKKSRKQQHVYVNVDLLSVINNTFKTSFCWHELFNELFTPEVNLRTNLDKQFSILNQPYVGVVFRFQQLLGDFKEDRFTVLSENEKEQLITNCLHAIDSIHQKVNCKILVTSDSNTFLGLAAKFSFVHILPGQIVHMDFTQDANIDIHQKTFLDFLMLSRASKIYSIIAPQMQIDGQLFLTEFPVYAAKTGNIPFERIFLNKNDNN